MKSGISKTNLFEVLWVIMFIVTLWSFCLGDSVVMSWHYHSVRGVD